VTLTPGVLFESSHLDYFGTVRGRLGYAFGSTLLYGTGGFAYGKLHDDICCLARTFDGTVTGYVVGGGLEYKFNPAWSLKAEYQYINFGRNDATLAGVSVCTLTGVKCEDDAFHTVRIGLNYHFGTGYVPLK
jgi:outer membrane immunogenic protein